MRKRRKDAQIPITDKICDFCGCGKPGLYKAPKDKKLTDHYWFCLDHVAQYNKNWDFYKDLDPAEIERHLVNDVTWQRPTWQLGHGGYKKPFAPRDPFGLFDEEHLGMSGKYNPPHRPKMETAIAGAAEFMGITFPTTLQEVKKKYKKLAKSYHPDMRAENATHDKFQELSDAYQKLLAYLKESA
ncbi:MAG: DnaJ domain-containing protein [Lactobacillales bacterium]|jgi:hypothetical protein|nr:DnaJ domain-containing protein [Lactobacillales bacterium]